MLPGVGKKIASRAAGKKTTVDRTILPWTVKEEEGEEEKGLAVGEESCGWKLCGAHMIKLLLLPLLFPWIAAAV
ncbi:unnamed protein product [Sphagnum balticum]